MSLIIMVSVSKSRQLFSFEEMFKYSDSNNCHSRCLLAFYLLSLLIRFLLRRVSQCQNDNIQFFQRQREREREKERERKFMTIN